jgi:uncharacterized protein (DUF1684 family)
LGVAAAAELPGDRELFVMFSDATSGMQTDGAGRFLYVGLRANSEATPEINRIQR